MNKHLYRHYSIGDFDNYDCLKLSKVLYLSLFFILRGYIVWIMSVTNMRDRVATLQWVYPDTSLFYLSLASGSLGLFVLCIVILRKPVAPAWVKAYWKYCRVILIFALLVDLAVDLFAYYVWHIHSETWLTMHSTIVVFLTVLLFKSQRFTINLTEFPEKTPQS